MSEARRARRRACTVLLVDDEPANLDLLEAVLEEAGYGAAGGGRILRTTDPRDVAGLAARHAPDVVLLDLHMPHRHGLDVLADLVTATPADEYRPVLVLTADVTGEARDRALSLGARDFLTKPFDTTEALLRVENLLDARALHVDEGRARERAALLAEWSRVLAASPAASAAAVAGHLRALVVPRWATSCDVTLEPSGTVTLVGPGELPADPALVDELSARLELAAEQVRLLAAAELATRERERLLAVVAHDLRNPLGAIALYAEVLRGLQPDDGADAYTASALAAIHGGAATMQRLVEDLLDASSLQGGALRVRRALSPLGAPFDDAARMMRPLAEAAGVALAVEAAAGASCGSGSASPTGRSPSRASSPRGARTPRSRRGWGSASTRPGTTPSR